MRGFSGLLYTAWRAVPATHTITVRLTNGLLVTLRRPPAGDILLLREIFVEEVYRTRDHDSDGQNVERIIDVGSNVGYSVLWLISFREDRGLRACSGTCRSAEKGDHNQRS